MWYIIPTAIILILLVCLFAVPIRLSISFKKASAGSDLYAYVKIGFKKIPLFPREKQSAAPEKQPVKKNESGGSVGDKIKAALEFFRKYNSEIRAIADYASRHAVRFERIYFHMTYSTADAAATGILCGVINGVVYGLLGAVHQRAELRAADIEICPDFGGQRLELDSECIAKLKNVHIIVITLKFIKLWLKIKGQTKGK